MSTQGSSDSPVIDDEDGVKKAPGTATLAYTPCSPNIAHMKQQHKYPGRGTQEDPFIVDWDDNDPENPFNWPKSRRWLITAQVRSLRDRMNRRMLDADCQHLCFCSLLSARGRSRFVAVPIPEDYPR